MTTIQMVASGDLRESANVQCWPAQQAMEARVAEALSAMGHDLRRAHPFKEQKGHGFGIAVHLCGVDIPSNTHSVPEACEGAAQ